MSFLVEHKSRPSASKGAPSKELSILGSLAPREEAVKFIQSRKICHIFAFAISCDLKGVRSCTTISLWRATVTSSASVGR